jgi:hypothetical protein
MAANLTDSEELALLNLMTGLVAYTLPTNLYVGLFTAVANQETASVTEVAVGSYARVQTVGKWGTPAAGQVATNVDIVFPTATADWGTITHVGLNSASTAGTWRWIGQLTASKVVNNGDIMKFLSGQLTLTLD